MYTLVPVSARLQLHVTSAQRGLALQLRQLRAPSAVIVVIFFFPPYLSLFIISLHVQKVAMQATPFTSSWS